MIKVITTSNAGAERVWKLTKVLDGKVYFELLEDPEVEPQKYVAQIKRFYGMAYIDGSDVFGAANKKVFINEQVRQFVKPSYAEYLKEGKEWQIA